MCDRPVLTDLVDVILLWLGCLAIIFAVVGATIYYNVKRALEWFF